MEMVIGLIKQTNVTIAIPSHSARQWNSLPARMPVIRARPKRPASATAKLSASAATNASVDLSSVITGKKNQTPCGYAWPKRYAGRTEPIANMTTPPR